MMLICTMLASSCEWASSSQETLLYTFHSVEAQGWDSRDTVTFELPIVEETKEGVVCHVHLRTTADYPYELLHLTALLDTLPAQARPVILHTYAISDTIYNQEGRLSGSGIIYREKAFQLPPFRLEPHRQYRFRFTHKTRRNPIPGIADIGIKLTQ